MNMLAEVLAFVAPLLNATRAWLATLTADQLGEARATVARVRTREAEALRDWIGQEIARRYPAATTTAATAESANHHTEENL